MKRQVIQVLLVGSLLGQACYGVQLGEPITSGLTNTVVREDRQYYLTKYKNSIAILIGYDMSLTKNAVGIDLPLANELRQDRHFPVRWRIAYDNVWVIEFTYSNDGQGTALTASLERLPWSCFVNSPYPYANQPDGIEIRHINISDPSYRTGMSILPLKEAQRRYNTKLMNEHGGEILRSENPIPAVFSFSPVSADEVRFFLQYDGIMEIWSYSFAVGLDNDNYWKWANEGTVPVVFEEPFQVYTRDNSNYFFITESGNIFAWKYGSKDAPGKVWDADKAPVKTIIQDADSDKVYAFAGGQYFELSEKIKPKEYSRSLAQLIGMSPSKNQLIEMARIIRADQSAVKKK